MPYLQKVCTVCDQTCERYHNQRKCPHCGKESLVQENRYQHPSAASLMLENKNLRAEVNVLRVRLGIGVKYREWEKGPAT